MTTIKKLIGKLFGHGIDSAMCTILVLLSIVALVVYFVTNNPLVGTIVDWSSRAGIAFGVYYVVTYIIALKTRTNDLFIIRQGLFEKVINMEVSKKSVIRTIDDAESLIDQFQHFKTKGIYKLPKGHYVVMTHDAILKKICPDPNRKFSVKLPDHIKVHDYGIVTKSNLGKIKKKLRAMVQTDDERVLEFVHKSELFKDLENPVDIHFVTIDVGEETA